MKHVILSATAVVVLAAATQATAGEPTPAEIDRLIAQLRSEDFDERQAATRALELIGEPALKALRHTAQDAKDLETRRRAEALANKIGVIADAIAAIRKRGGTVVVDPVRPGKPAVAVTLAGPEVRDADMGHVAVLRSLQTLRLRQVDISAAGLERLRGLTALRTLELSGCLSIAAVERPAPFGPQLVRVPFLQSLAGMQKLEELDLSWTSAGGADLDDLRKLSNLRRLNLSHTPTRGDDLPQLKDLPKLRALDLSYTGVHDAHLAHLAALKALEELDLEQTWITDAGLKALAKATGLRKLNLARCIQGQGITDAGLEHLDGLKSLERLDVTGTRVTPAGLKRLRDALPRLETVP